MSKKRLLVIAQHYWPEEFRINDIVAGFVESGVEVDVLCGIPNYPKGKFYPGYSIFKNRRQQKDGVNIYRAIEIPRGSGSIGIFLNYISYPFFASFSMLRLLGKKYDRVLCYETSPVLMIYPAILFSKLKRLPLYSYVLDLWPENLYSVLPIENKALRSIAKSVSDWHYRHGGRLIALSQGMKDRLYQATGKSDIVVFPQYCEDIYGEKSEPKNSKSDRFNVMFAGNFSPAQDLDMLIEMAKRCKEEGIKHINFLMYGDGMSHADFVRTVSETSLDHYFTFFGKVSQQEVIEASKNADALYVSLANTAFLDLTIPAKLSSCMAMCRPLLCCLSGVGAKTVIDADCGFCSTPGDADELYFNLKKLSSLPSQELVRLSNNAKNYYKLHLSRKAVLPKFIDYVMENKI